MQIGCVVQTSIKNIIQCFLLCCSHVFSCFELFFFIVIYIKQMGNGHFGQSGATVRPAVLGDCLSEQGAVITQRHLRLVTTVLETMKKSYHAILTSVRVIISVMCLRNGLEYPSRGHLPIGL